MVRVRLLTAAVLLAMMIPAGWVIVQAMPGQLGTTEEVARLRNALLIEPSHPQDFSWTPAERPASFSVDQGLVPQAVQRFVAPMQTIDNTWERGLALANALRQQGPRGRPIQKDTVTTLQQIQSTGQGYCSDYTQVFNALTYAAGIDSREWGLSFDGYGGWGHAFSEFYVPEWQQWVFIDIFHGFYVSRNDQPLSVAQFHDALDNNLDITVHRLQQGRFLFPSNADALAYYRRGKNEFYLWWGNDSLSYDAHPLIKLVVPISRSLEQLAAITLGLHPTIRPIETASNTAQRQTMNTLKNGLLAALAAEVILGLLLIALLVRHRQLSRQQG
ncbi:transglutaminase-like domain-containing protein [Motiliproteus sediminis]|uniref:transglutaminase-like domain-containing protein n=1 Tax=Motiliproteus sediminis TaxID=1468178 RepID=UPI001AEF48D0|nr:transglutaminase-like domain-containing protein [Motiliproteus sediminis]